MLEQFDHVTIAVHALQPSIDRYAALLGAQPMFVGGSTELGTDTALFGLRNSLIELVAPREGAAESEGLRALLQARGEGVQAIAFTTPDAAACSTALRAKGVRATPPEDGGAQGRDGSRRSYRTVELSQRATRGLSVLVVERGDTERLRGASERAPEAVDALDHVVVRTADPNAAITTYGTGMGIRLALDRELRGTRMLFFRIGGVTLEVVQDAKLGEHDAFYGLAYRVRDIAAAHARLAGHGFAPSEIRDGNKPGTRVFTLREGTCGVPTLILRDPARD